MRNVVPWSGSDYCSLDGILAEVSYMSVKVGATSVYLLALCSTSKQN